MSSGSDSAERPALRSIRGGGEPPTLWARLRPSLLLVLGGLGLTVCSVLSEHARALGGKVAADLALAALIACSIVVITAAVRRYASAFLAWAAAGLTHVVAAAVGFAYFHLALFARLPYEVSRQTLLREQGKALVGFVLVVGVVCMIGSAIRKAVK